jgi:cell division protein FtsN
MYGSKEAARDAARDFMKETPAKPTVEEGKLPATAATAGAETRPAAEDKWTYYLQAGAFRERADAEGERAKLALQGYEATIQERVSETGTLYRVRLGPFTELDAMNRVRGKLTENGIDVAVIRVAK